MGKGARYQFHHYEDSPKGFEVKKVEEWKEKMLQLFDGSRIIENTTWRSSMDIHYARNNPTDSFNRLRHIFESKGRPIYHMHHRFEIFKCERDGDASPFYLSFEKNGTGIVVQYSNDDDKVVYRLKGERRECKTEDIQKVGETVYTKPLIVMMRLNRIDIKDIINNWQTVLKYSLLRSNCQSLAFDIKLILNNVSEGVKFKFPGSGELVSLSYSNRDSIISLLDTYYSNCLKDELTIIERFVPRVLVSLDNINMTPEEGKEFNAKKQKDRLDVFIMGALTRYCELSKTGVVYFNNLNKRKMENSLNEALKEKSDETNPKLSKVKCQKIAEFWSSLLDGVMISEELGVIIIGIIIEDKDETEMDNLLVEEKELLIKELTGIGMNEQKEEVPLVPVTTIKIVVADKSDPSCISLTEQFDDAFKSNLDKIKKRFSKIKKNKTYTNQIKFLTGCLLMLQNMEDAETLLFDRVTKQHWIEDDDGNSTRIVWSLQQKQVIDSIHFSMKRDTRLPDYHDLSLRQFVLGCPGSGKTFILLHAIQYYCEQWPDYKVMYIAPEGHVVLFQQIKLKLEKLVDEGKVELSTKISADTSSLDQVGLIAFDEFRTNDHLFIRNMMEIAHKSGIHVIFVSMVEINKRRRDFDEDIYSKLDRHELKGRNYRSDKAIVELVNNVQLANSASLYKTTVIEPNFDYVYQDSPIIHVELLSPNIYLSSVKAKHIKYITNKDGFMNTYESPESNGDNSLERNNFIKACIEYILSVTSQAKYQVLIYNICHYSLLERIRQNLKEECIKHNGKISETQFEKLEFKDCRASQGGEYAISIGIYDHVSVPYELWDAITTSLTRTVLSAHLLINIAETVPLCNTNGEPCIIYEESEERSLVNIISSLDVKKENPYLLVSSDVKIDTTQIPYDVKFTGRGTGETVAMTSNWNMADVIIGNATFYEKYGFSASSIHSCSSIFIVTGDCVMNKIGYTIDKEKGTTEEEFIKKKHKDASNLLVNKIGQL